MGNETLGATENEEGTAWSRGFQLDSTHRGILKCTILIAEELWSLWAVSPALAEELEPR